MNKPIDIAIIGAGIVGCALACLLAQETGLNIGLIERGSLARNIENFQEYDARVSAITISSEKLFEKIGAWEIILEDRASAFKKMFVWDSSTQAHIEFNATDVETLHLGHLIENKVLLNALFKTVKKKPNIILIEAAEPETILENTIHFKNKESITATLIIGADGAKSWVREQAGIPWETRDYHHTAIVCSVTTEHSHEQTAWQCFTPEGPIALLPFENEHHCSIVWSSSPENAAKLMLMNDTDFQEALAKNFEYKLGKILSASKRHAFALTRAHAKNILKNNILLVGDAAHTIHPLAGQGLNLGLMDVAELAESISKAISAGKSWHAHSSLRRYERSRKSETFLMIQTMDQLKNLFASKNSLVKTVRQIGLNIVNKASFIKKKLTKQGMGLNR